VRAEGLEAKVWDHVRGVLTHPDCLEAGLQKLIKEGGATPYAETLRRKLRRGSKGYPK
jgi:hypothetical protein